MVLVVTSLCFDHLRMRESLALDVTAALIYIVASSRFCLHLLNGADWTSLRPNILAILALNEKMPGSVVDIGWLKVHTKFLSKIPRHLPKIHVSSLVPSPPHAMVHGDIDVTIFVLSANVFICRYGIRILADCKDTIA